MLIVQLMLIQENKYWIPAFAGMTKFMFMGIKYEYLVTRDPESRFTGSGWHQSILLTILIYK